MNTTGVIILVIVIVVVVALVLFGLRQMQRRKLRDRFGDEYQRVVDEKGGRSAAEAELRRREREHATLELHELSDAERTRYRDGWVAVQSLFVDDPVAAVRDGDRLVTDLVAARGYPVADYEDRLAHLSVEHANVLNHYRDAHAISQRNDAGQATTEELRQALVHYRELFADLLGEHPVGDRANGTTGSSVNGNAMTTSAVATTNVGDAGTSPVTPAERAAAADRDAVPTDAVDREAVDRDATDREATDRQAMADRDAADAGTGDRTARDGSFDTRDETVADRGEDTTVGGQRFAADDTLVDNGTSADGAGPDSVRSAGRRGRTERGTDADPA